MADTREAPGELTLSGGAVGGRDIGPPDPAPTFHHLRDMTAEEAAVFRRDVERTSAETWRNALRMLEQLKGVYHGVPVDQYEHALQCATRAYRANTTDEMVLVALLHDVGKSCSIFNHEEISAGMLKPFVSDAAYALVKAHTDFQGRFHYAYSGRDPDTYMRYRAEPWFDLALTFSVDWDCAALDPSYPSKPLADFVPLLEEMLSKRRAFTPPR